MLVGRPTTRLYASPRLDDTVEIYPFFGLDLQQELTASICLKFRKKRRCACYLKSSSRLSWLRANTWFSKAGALPWTYTRPDQRGESLFVHPFGESLQRYEASGSLLGAALALPAKASAI